MHKESVLFDTNILIDLFSGRQEAQHQGFCGDSWRHYPLFLVAGRTISTVRHKVLKAFTPLPPGTGMG